MRATGVGWLWGDAVQTKPEWEGLRQNIPGRWDIEDKIRKKGKCLVHRPKTERWPLEQSKGGRAVELLSLPISGIIYAVCPVPIVMWQDCGVTDYLSW